MANIDHNCDPEKIASFIEGDLDPAIRTSLEEHFKQCETCALELQQQRLFMCELDSAFATPFDLAVPTNFARVVAVKAESDMSGARDKTEHKRALKFCALLSVAAFILLGAAASKAEIAGVLSVLGKAAGIFSLIVKALYEALAGIASIVRMLSRGIISDSPVLGFAGFIIIIAAIGLLSLLIVRYHRTRLVD